MQGAGAEIVDGLAQADLPRTPVSPSEHLLLEFVRKVTEQAYRVTSEDSQRLREAGWTDEQMAEAVYVTALFAFFNRVADAFGLENPGYLQMAGEAGRGDPPVESPESDSPKA